MPIWLMTNVGGEQFINVLVALELTLIDIITCKSIGFSNINNDHKWFWKKTHTYKKSFSSV